MVEPYNSKGAYDMTLYGSQDPRIEIDGVDYGPLYVGVREVLEENTWHTVVFSNKDTYVGDQGFT